MSATSYKIWGVKKRLYSDDKSEIDLLYLLSDTFCSTHHHKNKINKFFILSGRVSIETEYGSMILMRGEESPEILPNTVHRFNVLEDSVMIETAYVKKGKISGNDIVRKTQGGRYVKNQEVTEKELRKKGLLDSKKELGKIKERLTW